MEKFLERGDEWLVLRRQEMLTRGNNTNNYSESTMRVLKDITLSRTKAFNVVALVDFCSTVLQAYLVRRLLAFAHGRRADPRLVYTALCDRIKDVATQTATVVDDYRFLVPAAAAVPPRYTQWTPSSACVLVPAAKEVAFASTKLSFTNGFTYHSQMHRQCHLMN